MSEKQELMQVNSQTGELVRLDADSRGGVRSWEEIKAEIDAIQEIMENLLEEGVDYGDPFPGAPKKTLLLPGIQKLAQAFRLTFKTSTLDLGDGGRTCFWYRVEAKVIAIQTGLVVGYGIGECHSNERKWKRDNPADVCNTVLKMAKKRAVAEALHHVLPLGGMFDYQKDEPDEPFPARSEPSRQRPVRRSSGPPPGYEDGDPGPAASAQDPPADPGDGSGPRNGKVNAQQVRYLRDLLGRHVKREVDLAVAFDLPDIEQIPYNSYQDAIAWIQQ